MYSPILEPDFDVSFSEAEGGSHFDAAWASDVLVEVELLLQLEQLTSRVCCSRPLVLVKVLQRRSYTLYNDVIFAIIYETVVGVIYVVESTCAFIFQL